MLPFLTFYFPFAPFVLFVVVKLKLKIKNVAFTAKPIKPTNFPQKGIPPGRRGRRRKEGIPPKILNFRIMFSYLGSEMSTQF